MQPIPQSKVTDDLVAAIQLLQQALAVPRPESKSILTADHEIHNAARIAAAEAVNQAANHRPTKPRIIVQIAGGCLSDYTASVPVELDVIDWDNASVDPVAKAQANRLKREATALSRGRSGR